MVQILRRRRRPRGSVLNLRGITVVVITLVVGLLVLAACGLTA